MIETITSFGLRAIVLRELSKHRNKKKETTARSLELSENMHTQKHEYL